MPLGAPVFLTLDRPEANGLWVAQDTGGAIKGANRFDTFWGAGDRRRRRTAGGMSANGPGADPAAQGRRRRVRPLSPEEAELWARVTATIRPLSREPCIAGHGREPAAGLRAGARARTTSRRRAKLRAAASASAARHHARRKLGPEAQSGAIAARPHPRPARPSISTGPGTRSIVALERAIAAGDRVLLLITGHERPGEPPVQRGPDPRRGPRLAGGLAPCAANCRGPGAPIRRHGGGGSLYIILRRR